MPMTVSANWPRSRRTSTRDSEWCYTSQTVAGDTCDILGIFAFGWCLGFLPTNSERPRIVEVAFGGSQIAIMTM